MSDRVPSFFVYGEPDRPVDVGFLHVETVMERSHLHSGRVSAHKHDRMAQITFWTRGRGEYFIEDRRLDFIAPAVSFIPSGVVHGFTVVPEETDAIVVSIADSALPPIAALSSLPVEEPIMVRGQAGSRFWPSLAATMQRLLEDYRVGQMTPLGALLAVAMNDIALLGQTGRSGEREGRDLASAFRRLVDRHFRDAWPVERYVAALGTTPHLLARACAASHGVSVKAFIDRRRLIEAKRLLVFTIRSVEDVAYEIGFRDPAYFSRFFRKHVGAPPGEWRADQGHPSHHGEAEEPSPTV
ncbi:helix-turn-helix domain-containing protein [Labrys sp. KNU-23]|uniref:helix-turn-helix domain-containing protein n=1 Tax=Labrys sp. KNU-23 TaxID=2789216 RepID=UPI0011ECAE1C|nr:helix-turn-helix domain-containing protein [Labrys sp. KNU-23]QEN85388.1 helix-turn-helix domain-containing protein [Labrys sp. KNU-23]